MRYESMLKTPDKVDTYIILPGKKFETTKDKKSKTLVAGDEITMKNVEAAHWVHKNVRLKVKPKGGRRSAS